MAVSTSTAKEIILQPVLKAAGLREINCLSYQSIGELEIVDRSLSTLLVVIRVSACVPTCLCACIYIYRRACAYLWRHFR